jgi:hypothetical protein
MFALNDCTRLMPRTVSFILLCVISSTGNALSPEVMAPLAPEAPVHVARHKAAVHKSVNEGLKIKAAAPLSREDVTRLLKQAADANKLPIAYLTRLIRQESGFDQNVVSMAGAQGIAQFMPATARDRGLQDPFDPAEALPKSAELLSDLKKQFGNLGLAAAAYNAGPQCVKNWLAGVGYLPRETWAYVYAITGRSAKDWAPPGANVAPAQPDEGLASTTSKNWELALLFAVSDSDTQRLLAAETSGIRRYKARLAVARPRGHLASEAALCESCIVQRIY